MELRRYRKNYRLKPEAVDSSVFVAFWADDKFVRGLDAEGVEWLLFGDHTLKEIEAHAPGFTRIHRGAIVSVAAIDRLMSRTPEGKKAPEHYCVVGGRELPVSRSCKSALYYQYRAHVSEHGFKAAAAA